MKMKKYLSIVLGILLTLSLQSCFVNSDCNEEVARKDAEEARAMVDRTYIDKMNLNASQFIQLRAWNVIEKKQGANIDVLVRSSETQEKWNIKHIKR